MSARASPTEAAPILHPAPNLGFSGEGDGPEKGIGPGQSFPGTQVTLGLEKVELALVPTAD
jgi:hypothetical protein